MIHLLRLCLVLLVLALIAAPVGAQDERGLVLDSSAVRASGARTLSEFLAGRVPGLAVARPSGVRGVAAQLRMRGASGLVGAAEPLLYIDGMLVRDDQYWLGVLPEGHRPAFAWELPVAEIESIRIVRGQSAGALMEFGAPRGAVFVTTTRPTAGTTRVSGFIEGRASTEATAFPANHGAAGVDMVGFTDACTLSRQALGECVATGGLSVNPLEEAPPFDGAMSPRAGVSATGGAMGGAYRAAAITDRDLGVLSPSRSDRLELSATFRNAPGAPVALTIDGRHVNASTTFTRWEDILAAGMLGAPGGPADDAYEPDLVGLRSATVPVHRDRTTLGASARWTVREGVVADARVGVDRAYRHGSTHEEIADPSGGPTSIFDTYSQSQSLTWSVDGGVRVTHRLFGVRAALDARAFASQSAFDDSAFSRTESGGVVSAQGFTLSPRLGSVGAAVAERLTFGASGQRSLGAGIRASNVSFVDNVSVGLAHRLDASWEVAQEAFFPRLGWLDRLQLSASHGAGADLDPVMGLLRAATVIAGGTFDPSDRAPRVAETAFDLRTSILSEAVSVELGTFRRVASDMPLPVPPPIVAGPPGPSPVHGGNVVEVRGEEFRIALNQQRVGPLSLNIAAHVTTARERVTHLAVPEFIVTAAPAGALLYVSEGGALGEQRGWDLAFNDANGDGIIDRTEVSATISGTHRSGTRPTRFIGASGDLSWRAFRFGAVLDAQQGHRRYDDAYDLRCRLSLCQALYDPATPLEEQARAVAARYGMGSAGPLQDAGFVRLREVWLSVAIPARWVPGVMGAARVTLSGHQLAVWTKYEGLDPEVGMFMGPSLQANERLNQPLIPAWSLRIEFGR